MLLLLKGEHFNLREEVSERRFNFKVKVLKFQVISQSCSQMQTLFYYHATSLATIVLLLSSDWSDILQWIMTGF